MYHQEKAKKGLLSLSHQRLHHSAQNDPHNNGIAMQKSTHLHCWEYRLQNDSLKNQTDTKKQLKKWNESRSRQKRVKGF